MPLQPLNAALKSAAAEEIRWLSLAALPFWAARGFDPAAGIFFERLALDGTPVIETRRARVQARQIYCFALAARRGWHEGAADVAGKALETLLRTHLREDGLLLHLIAADGRIVDAGPDLYDQAFLLLALAEMRKLTGDSAHSVRALKILDTIRARFTNSGGGFFDRPDKREVLRSNPHMHLLETAMAWIEADDDERWQGLARECAGLCETRFRDPATGALMEYFDTGWSAVRDPAVARIEPGHLFEWAWLLKRWQRLSGAGSAAVARHFYDLADRRGVCGQRESAVDELTLALVWVSPRARLWPQTERLKAALALLEDAPDNSALAGAALSARRSLRRYRENLMPGLWRDKQNGDGSFVEEPAPASTFYHLICAFDELNRVASKTGAESAP